MSQDAQGDRERFEWDRTAIRSRYPTLTARLDDAELEEFRQLLADAMFEVQQRMGAAFLHYPAGWKYMGLRQEGDGWMAWARGPEGQRMEGRGATEEAALVALDRQVEGPDEET